MIIISRDEEVFMSLHERPLQSFLFEEEDWRPLDGVLNTDDVGVARIRGLLSLLP